MFPPWNKKGHCNTLFQLLTQNSQKTENLWIARYKFRLSFSRFNSYLSNWETPPPHLQNSKFISQNSEFVSLNSLYFPGNPEIISHNSDIFLTGVTLYRTIQTLFLAILRVCVSLSFQQIQQFWLVTIWMFFFFAILWKKVRKLWDDPPPPPWHKKNKWRVYFDFLFHKTFISKKPSYNFWLFFSRILYLTNSKFLFLKSENLRKQIVK